MLYVMADNNIDITASRDGAMYNVFAKNQDFVIGGVGDELEVSYSDSSFTVTLGTGEAVVCGRHVTELSQGGVSSINLDGSTSGYVVIRVDLSKPAGSEVYLYSTPTLVTENLNDNGIIHDIALYQFTTSASGISNFVDVRKIVKSTGELLQETELEFKIKNGLAFRDSTNTRFTGIVYNGSNFFIGTAATSNIYARHVGQTFISTGWQDSNKNSANPSIKIFVPTTSGANAYWAYHEGYKPSKADVGLSNVDNVSQENIVSAAIGTLLNSTQHMATIKQSVTDLVTNTNFTYQNGCSAWATSGSNQPRALKRSGIVQLKGAIRFANTAQSSADAIIIGKVPAGYEPAYACSYLQQGSGAARFQLMLGTDGTLTVDRYGTTANAPIPAGAWLNISCVYMANTI